MVVAEDSLEGGRRGTPRKEGEAALANSSSSEPGEAVVDFCIAVTRLEKLKVGGLSLFDSVEEFKAGMEGDVDMELKVRRALGIADPGPSLVAIDCLLESTRAVNVLTRSVICFKSLIIPCALCSLKAFGVVRLIGI